MALLKCKECGNQVSSEATACPACGAKPPATTSILTWIVAGIALVGVLQCASREVSSPSQPPARVKSEAEKKADADINIAIGIGRVLKKSSKDPSSFKMESFIIYPNGSACYEYRAKNSFGALVPGQAVYDSALMLTSERDGNKFVKAWNAVCTKPGGSERAGGLNLLNVW